MKVGHSFIADYEKDSKSLFRCFVELGPEGWGAYIFSPPPLEQLQPAARSALCGAGEQQLPEMIRPGAMTSPPREFNTICRNDASWSRTFLHFVYGGGPGVSSYFGLDLRDVSVQVGLESVRSFVDLSTKPTVYLSHSGAAVSRGTTR
jgi:hypothetical protein